MSRTILKSLPLCLAAAVAGGADIFLQNPSAGVGIAGAAVASGVVGNLATDFFKCLHRSTAERFLEGRSAIDENHVVVKALRLAHLNALAATLEQANVAIAADGAWRDAPGWTSFHNAALLFVRSEEEVADRLAFGTDNLVNDERQLRALILDSLPDTFDKSLASRRTTGNAVERKAALKESLGILRAALEPAILREMQVRTSAPELPQPFIDAFRGESGCNTWFDLFVRDAAARLKADGEFARIWAVEQTALIKAMAEAHGQVLSLVQADVAIIRQQTSGMQADLAEVVALLRNDDNPRGVAEQGMQIRGLKLPPVPHAIGVAARRKLFLRPPIWENICSQGYARRPLLDAKLVPECRRFLEKAPSVLSDFEVPIFWIGGRSGDGKSILLLQLAREMLNWTKIPPIVLFEHSNLLLSWLAQNWDSPALAGPDVRLIAIVDDLHKLGDWQDAKNIFERAATRPAGLAVITCGPSPERDIFTLDTTNILRVTCCDTKQIDASDWQAIADHLEINFIEDSARPTLVERVFFSLPERNEHSLHAFAESLKARIDGRVERSNLLEQLTAMTMLDLALPASYVGGDDANWLDVLSEETQLHVATSDNGYRFGHPAIASLLFEALTHQAGKHVRLEYRLADTLTPILNEFGTVTAIARVLQQVRARLKSRKDIDSEKVLERILKQATRSTILRATVISIIGHRNVAQAALGPNLVNIARTIRSDSRADRETRAHVTRQLAMAIDADRDDIKKALSAMRDPELAPLMAPFVHWLTSKKAGGLMRSSKDEMLSWVKRFPDKRIGQTVLVAYLINFRQDPDVRAAAIEYACGADVRSLTVMLMQGLAVTLETEAANTIRDWLAWHSRDFSAAEVLVALLAKRDKYWQEEATSYLAFLPKESADYGAAFARLLPFLEQSASVQHNINELSDRIEKAEGSGNFYQVLAGVGRHFEVVEKIEKRLRHLLKDRADYKNVCEAIDLFGKAWPLIGAHYPEYAAEVERLFHTISEGCPEYIAGRKVYEASRSAITEILKKGTHSHLYAHAAIAFLDSSTESAIEGMIAGCFLIEGPRLEESHPTVGLEIKAYYVRLNEIAWRNVRRDEGTVLQAQRKCTLALIQTMRSDNYLPLRKIIAPMWKSFSHEAATFLDAWLKNDISRDEAWNFILSDDIKHETATREKAKIVAQNQILAFQCVNDITVSPMDRRRLLEYIRHGLADYKTSPNAAWFALQIRSAWPLDAVSHIWRGVLVSAIEGGTLSRSVFWESFLKWQTMSQDVECRNILLRLGVKLL